MTGGSKGGRAALVALALITGLILAPAAGANLKPGSRHAYLVGTHKHARLALPPPRPLSAPKLTRDKHGQLRVAICVRYRVANWSSGRGVRRDRALVTVHVARRLLTTGPDPSKPLYRRTLVDTQGLNRQHVDRCYSLGLPTAASRFVTSKGAFATGAERKRSARRLVWVDIQQDRDFKRVDGRYDWREGTAFSAADTVRPLRRTPASIASSNFYANPSGTLSVSNNTNSGVYCSGCTAPVSGTTNSSTYAVPLAVAGNAVQCFDSNTNGSDPQGFANYDAAGNPQPYPPDTTVTETIAADYTLAWAGNQQTADSAGFVTGTIKVGLQVLKTLKTGFPSPGALITGIVGIFEYFLENSCKESGNYFNVTAAETKGAAASSTINTNLGFAVAGPTGSTPPGLQLNPSALTLNGSHLWLNNEIVGDEGLSDYSCLGCGNTNAIDLNWDNFNPCHYKPAAECSLQPPQTPTVTSGTGNINCGSANTKCPFPAADWPATDGRQQIYAGMSGGSTGVLWSCDPFYQSNCGSLYLDSGNNISALAYNGSNAIFMGDSNADLYACSPSISGACNETGTTGSHDQITALAYSAANSIFAAIYNTGGINAGQLWVCNPVLSGSARCTQTYEFGNGVKISDLVSLSPYVFAAGSNGSIYQCSLSSLTCSATFTFSKGVGVDSLTTAYGQLWAGLSNGQLWTCNPSGTSCSPWDTLSTAAAITSLAAGPNHTVYVGAPVSNSPTQVGIWQCGTGGANDCTGVTATSTVSALTFANNYLYYGTTDGAYIYQCNPNPTAVAPCTQLDSGSESSQYIAAMVAAPPG